MLVHRIETETGGGPYCVSSLTAKMATRYYVEDFDKYVEWHPNPYRDPLLCDWAKSDMCWEWYFGFKDHKQLCDWFPSNKRGPFHKWNDEHPDHGFGISIYEIDSKFVKVGSRQVCFIKNKATLLSHEQFRRANNIRQKIINAITG